MYNKWQVRNWYRGINKAVDLVTMLRFVLALENWVWAKIKRVYRWFTETLLRPLLEIAKWVLGICAYETTTMICLSDQQTKDSSCAIPNAQSNLNWISYIWKRNFFPCRLVYNFLLSTSLTVIWACLPYHDAWLTEEKGKALDSDSGLCTFLGLGRIFAASKFKLENNACLQIWIPFQFRAF